MSGKPQEKAWNWFNVFLNSPLLTINLSEEENRNFLYPLEIRVIMKLNLCRHVKRTIKFQFLHISIINRLNSNHYHLPTESSWTMIALVYPIAKVKRSSSFALSLPLVCQLHLYLLLSPMDCLEAKEANDFSRYLLQSPEDDQLHPQERRLLEMKLNQQMTTNDKHGLSAKRSNFIVIIIRRA